MATQKTLAPTNQVITIDAFQGEKPDYRHVADAETKLADAVNALNSQIGTYDVGTNTLANIESALATYADTLANNEFKNVKFTVSTATGLFSATTYFGVLRKVSTGRYNISVQGLLDPTQTIYGNYRNSAWAWDNPFSKITLNNVNSVYFDKTSNSVAVAFIIGTQRYTARFRLDTPMISLEDNTAGQVLWNIT